MNKLITTIATIALCSFFSNVLTTPAEAKSRKHHRHHHHKVHHKVYKRHTDPRHGLASWYGSKFHGRKTATGERYNMYAMTAAHKSLPLRSYVQVTNLRNHRSVIVRINDRGPYHGSRVMDLSYAAAKELGMKSAGTAPVEITPISELVAVAQMQGRPG